MIQIRDLQFPQYFLVHELNLDQAILPKVLNMQVEINSFGEPDTVDFSKDNTIVVHQPSSITKFLFIVLYNVIKHVITQPIQQDKLGLGLLFACKGYVYSGYDTHTDESKSPPVLLDQTKLPVCDMVVKELIEPLVGQIKSIPCLFMKSAFVDACELAETSEKFSKRFKLPFHAVSFHDYPFLVTNSAIYNEAALLSHICVKTLEHSLGRKTTEKVVKNLVLTEDTNIGANLLSILKILKGDPIFLIDFLKYFKSNVLLTPSEEKRAAKVRHYIVESDGYLSEYVKTAQVGHKYTPQVYKQWHEWSMIMGLIEKQLEPMRGSMWPSSETLKPLEDEHRQMEAERAKEKGKTQLNFEELLELARDWFGHKAVQPGELAEKLLRENRVWKT